MAEDAKVFVIRNVGVPGYQFEWHPYKKKVYVIRLGQVPLHGEAFAHEITDQGAAINAVLIWARGFKEASIRQVAPVKILGAENG